MRQSILLWLLLIPLTGLSLLLIGLLMQFKLPTMARASSFYPLIALPIPLLGIAGLCNPLWLLRQAQNTIYVITNERAISFEGGRKIRVQSYRPSHVAYLERKERADGSGDLILRQESGPDSDVDPRSRNEGFYDIDQVRAIGRLAENLFRAPLSRTPDHTR